MWKKNDLIQFWNKLWKCSWNVLECSRNVSCSKLYSKQGLSNLWRFKTFSSKKILYFIVFVLWIVSYLHPCERKVRHLLVSFHVNVKEHIAETTDAGQPLWPRRPARGSFPLFRSWLPSLANTACFAWQLDSRLIIIFKHPKLNTAAQRPSCSR